MGTSAFRPIDIDGVSTLSDEMAPKVIHAGTGSTSDASTGFGQAYISVRQDIVSIVAGLNNAISVTSDYGITLGGPISFGAMPDQMSYGGGYWRINPLVLTCMPSTTATPVPWLIQSSPKLTSGQTELTSSLSYLQGFSDIG